MSVARKKEKKVSNIEYVIWYLGVYALQVVFLWSLYASQLNLY